MTEKNTGDSGREKVSTSTVIPLGAGLGVALGAGVGAAFGDVAIGAGIGTALGAAVGTVLLTMRSGNTSK